MKKLFGKKEAISQPNGKSLKQSSEIMPNPSKDNTTMEKFYKSFHRKSPDAARVRFNLSKKTSNSEAHHNYPNFSKHDSFSVGQSEETSTSKNFFQNNKNKNERGVRKFVNFGDITPAKDGVFKKSKSTSKRNSDGRSRSQDRSDQIGEDFFLKKTNEKANLSFNNSEINFISDNDLQYVADRLTLTDETSSEEATVRSTALFSESLPNKIYKKDSQGGKNKRNERKLLSSMPFQKSKGKTGGTSKPVVKKKRKTNKENPRRNTSYLRTNKLRIMNFFVKTRKSAKKTKSIRSDEPKKKDKKATVKSKENPVCAKEDLEIKQKLLDFFIHLLHLIFITTIAVSMVCSTMYYFTSITASLFFNTRNTAVPETENKFLEEQKNLKESITIDDFWAFAESTLIDVLYSKFFNPDYDPLDDPDKRDKNMFYENQILGVARLRQVRVKSDSCQIHPSVKRFFDSCYYYYSVFSEDVEPIKKGMEGTSTATAWVYSEADSLHTSYYRGKISVYGGGGYYLDLAPNKKDALEMVKELKKNLWVSAATRAVFIDFNLYNANTNLFCLCKIVLEFPPSGGMLPKADFHTLKLIRYLTIFDFFILACEILYILFALYYTYHLFITISTQGLSFFLSFWNYVEVLILALSYTYIILSILRYIYVNQLMYVINDNFNKYTEFHFVKELQINHNNVIAVLLFLCWIKLLKFTNFNKKLLELNKTLGKSLKDILWFLPLFLIVLFAFATLGNLFFGNQLQDFSTVWISFMALLLAFVGNFNYNDMMDVNSVLGTVFFISFIFFIIFLLLNVFVAIVVNAYISVKSEVILTKPRTGTYLRRGFVNFFTCCRHPLKNKHNIKKLGKKILFQEIERALQKAGFTTTEIKIFFCKYNINANNFLNESTKTKLMEDLELRRVDFNDTSEQSQINFLNRKVDVLRERMENLEINLVPVIDKVDILLQKL